MNKKLTTISVAWCTASLLVAHVTSCTSGSYSSVPVPASFNGKILLNGVSKLDQLLSIQDVAGLAGAPGDALTIHIEDYDERPERKKLAYHWPTTDDPITFTTISGEAVSIPKHHSIGIANIEAMDQARFERMHLTSDGLQAAIDELVNDESINTDIAVAQASYWAQLSETLLLEKLSGVGETAVWEMPTQALHVYADSVAFTVTANIGDDPGLNKNKAIAFARLIFNNL